MSHDLRIKAHHFVNDDTSKIKMFVRLNKLQNHFVFVVASKQIGKLKRTFDIEPGLKLPIIVTPIDRTHNHVNTHSCTYNRPRNP
jgi:hypothetical protein